MPIPMPDLALLLGRRRRYEDIAVSIEEHIRERADELVDEGLPPQEAEQRARREFGNQALMEERSREAWQWRTLESILADLRLTLRRLRKAPGFALTVLLTLAIGIGANTAVFTVVDRILLQPLPYPDSNRIVALWLNAPGAGGLSNFSSGLQLSTSMYLTFADHNQTFQSMGIWTPDTANITGIAEPEQVQDVDISSGVLETLAVPPALGRWFSPGDQDPHGQKSIILSYGYWQRRFGGDRNVIGRAVQVDAQTRVIVGVMPRGFRIVDRDFDLLVPLAVDRGHQILAGFGFNGIGRLKPGVSLERANADISHLIPVWMDSWSNGPGTNPHYYQVWKIAPSFRSLKQQVIGNVSSVLWVVMATVGLVMLIACINIANLLLVRAESRQQELAIRAALGAGRARIARELLVESLLLGLLGGAAAVGVAWGALRLLVAIGPADLPRLSEVSLDAASLGFTLLLSVFSGLFFGAITAWKYVRAHSAALTLSSSRTASSGRARQRSRNILVVAQVAMALVLMVSALLMIRTFASLRSVEPGFADAPHVETISNSIPDLLVPDGHTVAQMQRQIADNLAAIPGVASVGFAADVPMDNQDPDWDTISAEGKRYEGGEGPLRLFNFVSPGYFQTMGTPIVAGRDFTWDDLNSLSPMVIVSESFARDSWGSAAAAIGKRVKKYSKSPWQQVIGVVEDVHVHGVDETAPPIVYWPAMFYDRFTPNPTVDGLRMVTFVVHTNRAGTEGFLGPMQRAVWQVNPNLPLASVSTMQELYSQSMARTSFTLVMLAIAGVMALALGIIGIYGVISYAVSQRTREIGIRLALGAQRAELKWMFVRSALLLTAVGVVLGVGAAAALTQWIKALLFGISPLDPITYFAVPLILAAAAALASYLPARRAAAVNPVEALRAE
jgi:predicted permease